MSSKKEYQRKYYLDHRKELLLAKKKYAEDPDGKRAIGRKVVVDAKSSGCQLCGYNKCLAALDFHHVGGEKSFILSKCRGKSVEDIQLEISKCVIVCANCHREIHAKEIDNGKQ